MQYKRDLMSGSLQKTEQNGKEKKECISCPVLQIIAQFTQKRAGFGELKAALRDKLKEIQPS